MKRSTDARSEAERLEGLWAGDFGNAYIERNIEAAKGRDRFWNAFLDKYRPKNVLEVGCNVGGNLKWLIGKVPPRDVIGVDINEKALAWLHQNMPSVNTLWSSARELPFRDRQFELTFTAGVLIHQPEDSLRDVMAELVRCSGRWVLCMEYFSKDTVEVPYRGQTGALFKRDYGAIYQRHFPELKLIEQGELHEKDGWDQVTYWMFERP